MLDVGTNNQERLSDPLYIGWRHERVVGAEYDQFVEAFVQAVKRKFPQVLLQWEDFAQAHAGAILERFRDQLCTFNDDIQGTASVATGTLLSAVAATGGHLKDQRVVIFGAGSAGCGIGEQIVAAMHAEGLPEPEARAPFFLDRSAGVVARWPDRAAAVPAEICSAERAGGSLATRPRVDRWACSRSSRTLGPPS